MKTCHPSQAARENRREGGREQLALRRDGSLHRFAGFLLLAFAASHLGFLGIPDGSSESFNLVFPFLSNEHLYVFAATMEASIAHWKVVVVCSPIYSV